MRPTGFYAPAQAPGGAVATGPQAEGQSAATALTAPGMDWSLYAQALSDREKELLDTESESPWVTKRYLSAIQRLKRDEFSANLLAEEQALWNESYVNQFGDSVAPRGVTSDFYPMQSEKLRLMQDDKERTNRKTYDPSRLMAVTLTAENADDAGLKALYKYQNYAANRINSIARRKAKKGDSLGADDPAAYSRRMLGRLHEELKKGHIVAYPILTSNKGRRNTYKVHVVRRADSQPFMQRLNKDEKFDWERPGRWGRFGGRLDRAKIRYDLNANMDAWVKDYRPTPSNYARSFARKDTKNHWDYIVEALAEIYGVGRTTIERIGSGMLSEFQQEASDKAAERSKHLFGFDDAQQWAYDKAHGGTRWGPRSMGGGYDTFGEDVVPHLCETQWGESDARCIQHLDDPTFGGSKLRRRTAAMSQYFSQFGG